MDYPKLYEGFPGVKIRGGISYFLWDRDHDGPCEVQTIWDGHRQGQRLLAISMPMTSSCDAMKRCRSWRRSGRRVSRRSMLGSPVRKPFGLPTNFKGKPSAAGLRIRFVSSRISDRLDRPQ